MKRFYRGVFMGFVNEEVKYEERSGLAKLFGEPRSHGDSRTIDHERNIWLYLLRTANPIHGPYVRRGFYWNEEYINLWMNGGTTEQIAEQQRLDAEALQQGFKKKIVIYT
jgi:hypothetical protein